MSFKRQAKLTVLLVAAALLAIITFLLPSIPQPISYHDFADKRVFFGIPSANDALSNFPLLILGVWGMIFLFRYHLDRTSQEEKNLWFLFFAASVLSAIFSAYYHLQPNHFRLALDRVGLSLIFMSFFSLMLIERLGKKIGMSLAPFILLLGISSVIYWIVTEVRGSGDLRLYGFVQFGPIILLLLLFSLFPSTLPGKGFLYLALVFYAIAKVCELWDEKIFWMLEKNLSGHTLKHLFAAGSTLVLILYLRCRKSDKARRERS